MRSTRTLTLAYAAPSPAAAIDGSALAVRLRCGGYDAAIRFEAAGARLAASGDALLCLGLVPAMELGVDLRIDDEVDEELLDHASEIQSLLCTWYPGYGRIAVDARPVRRSHPAGRETGLFFSGGVDSGYSLATARERISALVTLVGADVDPADQPRVTRLKTVVTDVADQFGMGRIVVTTDIRSVSDRLIGWVEYHGAVLAAVRHMLAHRFENQIIASSADESSWTRRWGSHPALDVLWGTAGARVEHHGLVHRLAKVQRIACEPVLMEHLRVCNRRFEHCGVCHSCQFMLAALDVLDMRDRAPTYRHLTSRKRSLKVTGEGSQSDMRNLRAAAQTHGDDDIVAAIDGALKRYRREKLLNRILPLTEIARRFKRFKRQRRFMARVGRPSP
ncbi:hypothetical protein [Aquibium microcysteis]|uniref:hypothetical protein n=1 Tax=Aquibium microcysteis TaxID=675281 RepID=UPI00165D08F9|nr:hypothetical protein [Aquibium microcysteis]